MDSMLNAAIGLVFVYLVLSLLCTTVSEALEQLMKYRAHYLRMGIQRLLLDGDVNTVRKLYAHPLVKSLYTETKLPSLIRTTGPSYIPSRQFTLALMDVITAGEIDGGSARTLAELKEGLARNENILPRSLVQALRTILADAGDDLHAAKAGIEQWFDGAMDRVTGWYKRRAQTVALVIGLGTAVGLNADTLQIVQSLSNDAAVRASLVAAAEGYAQARAIADREGSAPLDENAAEQVRLQSTQTIAQVQGLGIPIGRPRADSGTFYSHLLGWAMTGLALSLGAPFWFDLLSKIMLVRSTVRTVDRPR